MAKKQQSTRRERNGGGAATTSSSIERARQSATKRRGRAKNNDADSSRRPSTTQLLFALVAVLAFASLLLLIAPFLPLPTSNLVGSINDDEELLKTREFLSNFVCNYKPKSTTSDVDVDGYCHPKLVAAPKERTQRVAHDDYNPELQLSSKVYSRVVILQQWFQFISNKLFITTNKSIAIPAGELVMRLPRPLQIWDLDALRDEFIQTEFLGLSDGPLVTHRETGNPLDSGAFLAVHLIRLIHGLRGGECNDSESQECAQPSSSEWTNIRQYEQRIDLLEPYLDMLPARHYDTTATSGSKAEDAHHDHPLIWPKSTLESLFPKYTHTYDLIVHYRRMIQSEYDALGQASKVFAKNVDFSEYLNMRVNVLSRAFGVSATEHDSGAKWPKSEEAANDSLLDEMISYETSNFGTYLDKSHSSSFKLRSMSPLLDMYNSHPNPNVMWRYNEMTSSYDIRASNKYSLSPGDAIMVSYGKYTEGHLFFKFGYVNGDGSSPTEANLAVFHRPLGDVGLGRQYSLLPFHAWDSVSSPKGEATELEKTKQVVGMQSKELLRYLIFDDGYKECVKVSDNEEYNQHEELKLLKLQHLIRIANDIDAWVVRLPEKFPDAKPPQSLSERPELGTDTSKVGVNAKKMLSTCRLLSLTADDIGREAVDYLRDGLSSDAFEVEKDGPTLEYRTMMCVARMCGVAMSRYGEYLTPKGRQEPKEFGSREWNAWYVRDGEMRVLGILRQTLLAEANKLKRQHNLQNDAAMTMRENGACPIEYSLALLRKIST